MSRTPTSTPDITSVPSLRPDGISKPSEFLLAAVDVLDERGWTVGARGWSLNDRLCVLGAFGEVSFPAAERNRHRWNKGIHCHRELISGYAYSRLPGDIVARATIQGYVETALAEEVVHLLPGSSSTDYHAFLSSERLAMTILYRWNDSRINRMSFHLLKFAGEKRRFNRIYRKEVRPVLVDLAGRLAAEGK